MSVQLLWGRLTQFEQSGPHSYPRGLGITAKARRKTVVSKIWVSTLLLLPGSVCVCVCAVCKIRWLRPSSHTASAAIDSNQIRTILPFFSTRGNYKRNHVLPVASISFFFFCLFYPISFFFFFFQYLQHLFIKGLFLSFLKLCTTHLPHSNHN